MGTCVAPYGAGSSINEAGTRATANAVGSSVEAVGLGEWLRQAIIRLLGLVEPRSGRHVEILALHKAVD